MWTLGDNGAIKPSFKQFGLDNTNFTRIGWFDRWWIGDGNWYWNLFTQIWTLPSKKKKLLEGGLSIELEQCMYTVLYAWIPSCAVWFLYYFYKYRQFLIQSSSTVKLGNKERFVKEQICIKEPFPVTSLPFTS